MLCSQPTPNRLSSFPHVTRLQSLPCRYRSRLDADHVLVGFVRSEVGHPLGLLDPRVPDDHVRQRFPGYGEDWLARRGDYDRRGGIKRLVDAVYLGGDGNGIGLFSERGCTADFVDVRLGLKTRNACL